MKLKSRWTYNYKKGMQGPMVSHDYHLDGDKLYFSLSMGLSAFDSVLLELDLKTQEARTVFEEKHVMRTSGIHENGKIYLTSLKGMAYCVKTDGSICWSTNLGSTNASFKMALDEDRFYVSDYSVFGIDKNTGEILWKNDICKEKSNCNILVDDNYIYGGESGGHVFCIDKFTGDICWTYGTEEWISNVEFWDNSRLLVNHAHGKFYILDAQSGNLIDTKQAKGYLYTAPVLENNRMYIGDADAVINSKSGNMTCYEWTSQNDLKELFSVNTTGGVSTKAVIDGDRIFFAAEDNYLYCVDKNTGEECMPKKKTQGICRNIIVCENELILLSDKGQVQSYEIV